MRKSRTNTNQKTTASFWLSTLIVKIFFFAEESADAVDKARTKYPDRVFYVVKIGFETAEMMAQMFSAK